MKITFSINIYVILWGFIYVYAEENALLWKENVVTMDVLPLANQKTIIATGKGVFQFGDNFSKTPKAKLPEFNYLLPDENGLDLDVGIALKSDYSDLYTHLSEGTPQSHKLEIRGPITHLIRGQDTSVWLANQGGIVYRVNEEGEVNSWNVWDLDRSDSKLTSSKKFPFRFTESPEGKICVYQACDYLRFGYSVEGVLIWKDDQMRYLFLGESRFNFVEFLDEEHLLVGSSEGIRIYDTKEGKVMESMNPPEDFFDAPVKPYATMLLPDGTRIFFYCRTGFATFDRMPFKHGGFTQIVELKDGKWKKVPYDLDLSMYYFPEGGRPSAVNTMGGLWISDFGKGLAYRSPKGDWSHYGWEHNVPYREIEGIDLQQDRLWLRNKQRGVAVMNEVLLKNTLPKKSDFRLIKLKESPIRDAKGGLVVVTTEEGGTLIRFGRDGRKETIPFPEENFKISLIESIHLDSEGKIWLFYGFKTKQSVAIQTEAQWRIFSSGKEKDKQYYCWEYALQSMADKPANFRIGKVDAPQYPIFSGDGRVVFKNMNHRVSYFDGEKWHAPIRGSEIESLSLKGHPFFHNGQVVVGFSDGHLYSMQNEDWSKQTDGKDVRPWTRIKDVPSPFDKQMVTEKTRPDLCPIPADQVLWEYWDGSFFWVGSKNLICATSGESWRQMDIRDKPFTDLDKVTEVMQDSFGNIIFKISKDLNTYLIGSIPALEIKTADTFLGTFHEKTVTLAPIWELGQPEKNLLLQWKVDNGEWSKMLPVSALNVGTLPEKGNHKLYIRFFGKYDLSASEEIVYDFRTTFSLEAFTLKMIDQLGAATYRDRKDAYNSIEELGPSALEFLQDFKDVKDPEVRMSIKKLIKKFSE